MKAIPILEYLDRAARPPAARNNIVPLRLQNCAFGKYATGRHLAEAAGSDLVGGLDEDGARLPVASGIADSRKIDVEYQEPISGNMDARLMEAFERGWREGRAAALSESHTSIEAEIESCREQEMLARAEFQLDECAKLGAEIGAGLIAIEDRISAGVARILEGMIDKHQTTKAIAALQESLGHMRTSPSTNLMRIRGPEHLLAKLKGAVAGLAVDIDYVEADGFEVVAEIGETIIATQLEAWRELLKSSIE
jgi:hypothetical protein